MDTDFSQADALAACGITLPQGMPLDVLIGKMMNALSDRTYTPASPLYRLGWLAHCLKAWGAPSVSVVSRGYRESTAPQINLMYAIKIGEGAIVCVNGGFGWDDMLCRAQMDATVRGKKTEVSREWKWVDDREYQEVTQAYHAFQMHDATAAHAAVSEFRASLLTHDTAEVSTKPRSSSPRL